MVCMGNIIYTAHEFTIMWIIYNSASQFVIRYFMVC